MTSAKVVIQEELLERRGRAIDLSDLLSKDYGRGTQVLVKAGLETRLLDANQLLLTVALTKADRRLALALALRGGADPNLTTINTGWKHILVLIFEQAGAWRNDYYWLLMLGGLDLNRPAYIGGPKLRAWLTQQLGHDPLTLSQANLTSLTPLAILIKRLDYVDQLQVTNTACVAALLPPNIIDWRRERQIHWTSESLAASIHYLHLSVFRAYLASGRKIGYPDLNHVLLIMKQTGVINRYLLKIGYEMILLMRQAGLQPDEWQTAMLTELVQQSVPHCQAVAQQFPVDFPLLAMNLNANELNSLSNICAYTENASPSTTSCPAPNLSFLEDGTRYCFKPTEFSNLLNNKINPTTKKPLSPEVLTRLRNYYGSKLANDTSSDPIVRQFVYHGGPALEGRKASDLDRIVKNVYPQAQLSELSDEHAQVTMAWIGNWAREHDNAGYQRLLTALGESTPK